MNASDKPPAYEARWFCHPDGTSTLEVVDLALIGDDEEGGATVLMTAKLDNHHDAEIQLGSWNFVPVADRLTTGQRGAGIIEPDDPWQYRGEATWYDAPESTEKTQYYGTPLKTR